MLSGPVDQLILIDVDSNSFSVKSKFSWCGELFALYEALCELMIGARVAGFGIDW
jgi:hypothetical protein